MSTEERLISELKTHGLRITNSRKEVLGIFLDHAEHALSGSDIEARTESGLDRITLYRTLRTFEKSGLIHQAIDASGKIKYALCSGHCDVHEHQDDHAHFYCTQCEQTTCLDQVMVPKVQVPDSYTIEQQQLVISGICPNCS